MAKLFDKLVALFSGFGLTVVVLAFMFVVTLLGTVVQETRLSLFDTMRVYFESWIILQPVFDTGIKVPLPGMLLLMVLLGVNLMVGGILRMRWRISRIGILITHFGIAFLLMSGLVKFLASHSGLLTIWENERGAEYHDPNRHELVIYEPLGDGTTREYIVPADEFEGLRGEQRLTLRHADLPFELELSHMMRNCEIVPARGPGAGALPVVEGFVLQERPPVVGAQNRDLPGCYIRAKPHGDDETAQVSILWSTDNPPARTIAPCTVEAGGRSWGIKLRSKRRHLPFDVHVDDFNVEFHPGTSMAAAFSSDVVVYEGAVQVDARRIQMNEPLRRANFTIYQTNWGPQEQGGRAPRHYTVFEVSSNPSDQWPKWSCYIIGIGMLWHFATILMRYIARERRTLQEQA